MSAKLFTPYTVKGVTIKNRIVMAPMGTFNCKNNDGKVTDWHLAHYGTRADGQVGLIMVEATAVLPVGVVRGGDLGIWSDDHIEGHKRLVALIHECGSTAAIQLAHSGRKNRIPETIYAPSAIPLREGGTVPKEMTIEDIYKTIQAFKDAARRSKEAGYDIIEIHAAHGYLINSFLSPLTNHRKDMYGGDFIKRYRFLKEVIHSVKEVWDGPIFVRVSASEGHENGNTPDDYVEYAKLMKDDGVDLIDCSSGGIVNGVKYEVFPGYQVPYAEKIRKEANIPTGAVGLITRGEQAEEILQMDRADLIFIGRELFYNPYWVLKVAEDYNFKVELPRQYVLGKYEEDRFGVRVRLF